MTGPTGWAPKPPIRSKARKPKATRKPLPERFPCGHPGTHEWALPSGNSYRCKCQHQRHLYTVVFHMPPFPTVERTREWKRRKKK